MRFKARLCGSIFILAWAMSGDQARAVNKIYTFHNATDCYIYGFVRRHPFSADYVDHLFILHAYETTHYRIESTDRLYLGCFKGSPERSAEEHHAFDFENYIMGGAEWYLADCTFVKVPQKSRGELKCKYLQQHMILPGQHSHKKPQKKRARRQKSHPDTPGQHKTGSIRASPKHIHGHNQHPPCGHTPPSMDCHIR